MRIKSLRRYLAGLLLVLFTATLTACGTTGGGGSGQTGASQDYFKGKVITFIVPYDTGGGFDLKARLTAPYLQKYLPGSTITVENVPGAGSLVGTNQLYEAKPDGLTIGILNTPGIVGAQATNAKGVRFDLNKFTWLGRFDSDPEVLAVRSDTPYQSLADLTKAGKPVKVSVTGAGSTAYSSLKLLMATANLNIQPISGYQGSHDAELAVGRGEVSGVITVLSSLLPMLNNKQVRPLVVVAANRVDGYPDLPTAIESTSGQAQETMKAFTALLESGYSVAAPPGLDPAVALQLRTAFQKALQDPELLAAAKKARYSVGYLDQDAILKVVQAGLAMPDSVKQVLEEKK